MYFEIIVKNGTVEFLSSEKMKNARSLFYSLFFIIYLFIFADLQPGWTMQPR